MAAPSSASTSLYQPDVEAQTLALLLKHGGEIFGEFYLTDRQDFSEPHRPLWDIISLQLSSQPIGSLDPLLLSTKLAGAGVTSLQGGFEVFPYLEGLGNRYVEVGQALAYARELKRLRVRRDLLVKLDLAKKDLLGNSQASFTEMTGLVEQTISSVTTSYYTGDQFSPVFGPEFIEVMEERAANPLDATQMGWMGPFDTINRTLGALAAPHLFICIGARTGNQKSALGFYYHVCIAEKYNLPVLLLDCGEMTKRRIQDRAVCALSMGRVPLWAVKSGEWKANKLWRAIMEDEVYPRVRKLRFDYINVGHLSPREKISTIRRYYYSKIGRGNPVALLDDYLKGIEALGKNSAEHQAIGYYVNDIKNLITNEIPASFWSSVQNNRSGSYQGKKASEITDSEDQMGLSDRIIQQSDWGFILRFKVPEELASEKELFGNMRLTPVKTREALGKEYEKALRPVKVGNRFMTNSYNLESRGFSFTEKGDLRYAMESLGKGIVNLGDNPDVKGDGVATKPL